MRFVTIVLAMLLSAQAFAFGEPTHSKVEVTTKEEGKKVTFSFKVVPNKDMVITLDAPWKFEIKDKAAGLKFAKESMGKPEMDDKLPGYVVTSSEAAAKSDGEVEYSLVSFICTADKTACYREVHKGTHKWTVASK